MRFTSRMKDFSRRCFSAACAAALAVSMTPVLAFAQPAASDGSSSGAGTEGEYVADEIIVVYEPSADNQSTTQNLERMGIRSVDELTSPDGAGGQVVTAKVSDGESVEDAIERAESEPGVAYAQPNFVYRLPENMASNSEAEDTEEAFVHSAEDGASAQATTVSDPEAKSQYYLKSWDGSFGVNATEAWDVARADGSVTIAVLDTGIRVDHEDLKANIVTDYMRDIANQTPAGTITSSGVQYGDNCGHGTHVAGIAAAVADNATGIAGASYNAKVLPLKVFDDESDNPGCTTSDLVVAYSYLFSLVDEGKVDDLHVINMSLGGYGSLDETDKALEAKIKTAADTYQILTVAAGGNGDVFNNPLQTPSYPSDFDECMAVTATNGSGENVSWSDFNQYKDISAPGYSIYSTFNSSPSSYTYLSGTSMSSPLTAGVAALLWASCPTLTVDEAKTAIYSTASPLDPTKSNFRTPEQTGSHGVINAAASIAYVQENYAGISRTSMSECAIDPIDDQFYTGSEIEPSDIVVRHADSVLQEGVDYSVAFHNNKEVGTATVTISGIGSYIGFATQSFAIRYDISTGVIVPEKELYAYTGGNINPKVSVVCNGRILTEGSDYSLKYANNIAIGTASIVAEGLGKYMGRLDGSFVIEADPRSLIGALISQAPDQVYTGEAITPEVTVTTLAGAKLQAGIDYELSYENNVVPGRASVTATGKGAYSGSSTGTFKITQASAADFAVEPIEAVSVTGQPLQPALKVSFGGKEALLVEGQDYQVTYENNVEPGFATATITGIGYFEGQKTVHFRVLASDAVTFKDVSSQEWYAPYVSDASALGLMTGYSDENGATGNFGPEGNLTRAEAIVVMARIAHADTTDSTNDQAPFTDVDTEAFYMNAVNWAYGNGIVTGDVDSGTGKPLNTVRPNDSISREEVATMMYRLAGFMGCDTSGASADAFLACADCRTVTEFAVQPVIWTSSCDILSGFDLPAGKLLKPQDAITRAQMAKVGVQAATTIYA